MKVVQGPGQLPVPSPVSHTIMLGFNAYRFYELAVQKTNPGNYYQDASGSWKKK